MKINQLATRGNTTLVTTERQSKLGDFINQFILSNMFNVFKVIYVKNCGTKESWKEIVSSHVGGLREKAYLRYDVEAVVYVYSNRKNEYISQNYTFHNLRAYDIVDACFDDIRKTNY